MFHFFMTVLQCILKKSFPVLDVIKKNLIPFNIELQNAIPIFRKRACVSGKKVTRNTSFSVCTLKSRRKRNCPSEPVII